MPHRSHSSPDIQTVRYKQTNKQTNIHTHTRWSNGNLHNNMGQTIAPWCTFVYCCILLQTTTDDGMRSHYEVVHSLLVGSAIWWICMIQRCHAALRALDCKTATKIMVFAPLGKMGRALQKIWHISITILQICILLASLWDWSSKH